MSVKTSPASKDEETRHKKAHPQLIAWIVITIAFGVFCLIIIGTVSFLSDYLSHSSQLVTADLVVKQGPAYITHAGQNTVYLSKSQEKVGTGDTIIVEDQAEVQLDLFDGTKLVITGSTRVYLKELKITITNFVKKEKHISFEVSPGGDGDEPVLGRVVVWPSEPESGEFKGEPVEATTSDKAQMLFNNTGQNSYKIEVQRTNDNSTRTLITSPDTNHSQLVLAASGHQITLLPGQRVKVDNGQAPSQISTLQDELISNNGSFINGLDAWTPQKIDNGTLDNIPCDLFTDGEKIDDGTITRLHTRRYQNAKDSFECSIKQDLNVDVASYQNLNFRFKLKILNQSLTGGGFEGYEFPLFFKINYLDNKGVALTYFKGFYITAPDPQKGTRLARNSELVSTEQVKQGEWLEFVSEDLMALHSKPYRITSIQIGSAGHEYEAVFTDLSLEAKG